MLIDYIPLRSTGNKPIYILPSEEEIVIAIESSWLTRPWL